MLKTAAAVATLMTYELEHAKEEATPTFQRGADSSTTSSYQNQRFNRALEDRI